MQKFEFSNKIRNWGFWTLGALTGSRTKIELNDIKDSFGLSSFELLQHKNLVVLRGLLQTAVNSTEYYKAYKNFNSLEDFPVVNKSIIKANFDQINILTKDSPQLKSVSTSGSTGTPLKVYQTKRKNHRNTADTLFFANSSGFNLGDKLLYLRLWAAYYKKMPIVAKLQNIEQIDVEDLKDSYIAELLTKLQRDKSRKGWLGYPSGYERICKYLDKINSKPLDCNIKSIIAMSESLNDHVRSKMEYYFQAPIVSRYSNVENGILAQQMPGNKNFTINWASYIIEILDMKKDIPVKNGEIGRIVVTDLHNLATPFIRYDTGDVGAMSVSPESKNDFPMLSNLQGRITDMLYNTNGEIINAFVIYNNLYRYPEINQVQFIQKTTKDYVFKINCETSVFKREAEFVSFFKNYLGRDANVTVEYVHEVPLLKSGKRKIILNLNNTPE